MVLERLDDQDHPKFIHNHTKELSLHDLLLSVEFYFTPTQHQKLSVTVFKLFQAPSGRVCWTRQIMAVLFISLNAFLVSTRSTT